MPPTSKSKSKSTSKSKSKSTSKKKAPLKASATASPFNSPTRGIALSRKPPSPRKGRGGQKGKSHGPAWHKTFLAEILMLVIQPKINAVLATLPSSKEEAHRKFMGSTGASTSYQTFLSWLDDLGMLASMNHVGFPTYCRQVRNSLFPAPSGATNIEMDRVAEQLSISTGSRPQGGVRQPLIQREGSGGYPYPEPESHGDPLTNPLPAAIRGPASPPGGGDAAPRTNIPSTNGAPVGASPLPPALATAAVPDTQHI